MGRAKWGHVDMWHLLSGWKSTVMDKGWDVIQISQWWHERTNPLDQVLPTGLGEEKRERERDKRKKRVLEREALTSL